MLVEMFKNAILDSRKLFAEKISRMSPGGTFLSENAVAQKWSKYSCSCTKAIV